MLLDETRIVWVRRVMFWSALVGLFVSIYLLITYISSAPIVCGPLKGCDLVRASPWATSIGLPRPLWGVVFYATLIGLLLWRTILPHRRARLAYRLTRFTAAVGFIESAFLTFVQALDIRAFCLWCLTSALMATLIFVLVWFDRAEPQRDELMVNELRFQFWSLVIALVLGAISLWYLSIPRTDGERPRLTAPAVLSPAVAPAEPSI